MKTKTITVVIALGLVLLVLSVRAAGGPYTLTRWRVAGGGGLALGGPFALNATIGQAEAGAVMQGGSFSLSGGFWGGGGQPPEPAQFQVNVPIAENMYPGP